MLLEAVGTHPAAIGMSRAVAALKFHVLPEAMKFPALAFVAAVIDEKAVEEVAAP